MRFSHFFIRRPIFAGVIAIIITIVGAFAYAGLPVSQFPDIVPPTVTVSTAYPGASAETVADTVAAPIEQQINGVDNMIYQSSQSTGDGRLTITVTFKLRTDLDTLWRWQAVTHIAPTRAFCTCVGLMLVGRAASIRTSARFPYYLATIFAFLNATSEMG